MNRDVLNYKYVLDTVFGRLNDLESTGKEVIKDTIYSRFTPRHVSVDEIIVRYRRISTIEIKDDRLSEREKECITHFLAGKGYDSSDSITMRLATKMVKDHIARTGCDDPFTFFILCDFKLKSRYEGGRRKVNSRYDYFILGTGEDRYQNARYYKSIYTTIPETADNFLCFLHGYSTVLYTDYQRMRSVCAATLAKEEYSHIIRYL